LRRVRRLLLAGASQTGSFTAAGFPRPPSPSALPLPQWLLRMYRMSWSMLPDSRGRSWLLSWRGRSALSWSLLVDPSEQRMLPPLWRLSSTSVS
ncbi:hypothetical protein CLOP_g533, partial [Closterium sp. NIES-67]